MEHLKSQNIFVETPEDTVEQNAELNCEDQLRETQTSVDNLQEIREKAMINIRKLNVPNVNIPERIIICLDICYDDQNSFFRLHDGTTFTPINMLKRILDFFLHCKYSINKNTEFALLILKDSETCWLQNFTNNIKDVINKIDYINGEESSNREFDFCKIFEIIKEKVLIPDKENSCLMPPSFVVRMLILYGRSNCIPNIPLDNPWFAVIKKNPYFYIDILLSHEEDCASYKCAEIYDALQDLDNGYSYVFEVSRNATKIHDCIAKLLAHPLQRSLQRNANYNFGGGTA